MAYLQPADYPNYGLPAGTTADWITAATALINSYCRRPDLNVIQYTERLRVTSGCADGAAELSASGAAGHGDNAAGEHRGPLREAAARRDCSTSRCSRLHGRFRCPANGRRSIPALVDFDPNTGELTLPWNVLGLPYNEVQVTYTAGLATIGDDVKTACAQIVRNAQSTPALNASKTKIDTMQMQYFSSSLVDETVQAWLRPYVANRLG